LVVVVVVMVVVVVVMVVVLAVVVAQDSTYLTQVHDHALVNLLPQVSPEDLNQRNLESWNLAVHEDARQVELHLETHVHVGAVDRRRPPQREATVGDLVET
jgi:hypothetical protein